MPRARDGLYKRGPVWWYQWRGERKSLRVRDRKAAELAFAELQRAVADPAYRRVRALTVESAFAAYLDDQTRAGRAPRMLDRIGLHAMHACRLFGPGAALASVDASAVDRYVAARRAERVPHTSRPIAPLTVRAELATLRLVLRRAQRLGQYLHPLDAVIPRAPDGYTPGTRHVSIAQAHALVKALPPARAALVAFVLATGADAASVPLARREDFGATTIRVRGSKTAHRDRVVPILAPFAAFAALAARGAPFGSWANSRRDLALACARAGVPRVTLRDLRRSAGYALRDLGAEPHLISDFLGHAPGSAMAAKVYARLQPAALARLLVERVGGTSEVHDALDAREKPAKTRE